MGQKLTERDELAEAPAAGDFFHVVDVSDTTDSAEGTSKKVQAQYLTISDASTTVKGKVELATTAETETGTDATRAVTPDGLHDMTTLSGAAWFLDEDSMTSNSAVKVPSQQSVKAYVDRLVFPTLNVIPLFAPRGFMINGKFTVTDTGSGINIALKTLVGADPSATDPVYIRIGDTVRSVTAALSRTISDGTNHCNAGSSELATKEIDWALYAVWDSNSSAVALSPSRIFHGNLVSDFSATTTNEKHLIGYSDYTTTDEVEVIGRFAATLSAGAGYTWSVPTYTAVNLIQRPIFETRWLDWVPQGTVSGGTAPTYTLIDVNKYKITSDGIFWKCDRANSSGGTAGSGANRIVFSLPFANADYTIDRSTVGGGFGTEGAGTSASIFSFQDTSASQMCFLTATGASWAGNDQSSVDRRFSGQGFYRI